MEANYKYNALGQRMMKIVSYPNEPSKSFIRKFTFDGDEILSEFDGDNNRLVTYTHSTLRTDDTLSADVTAIGAAKKIAKEAGSFFFLKDALGSITDITDSSGNLKEHIAYSSFGSILKVTDELNQDKTTDRFFNFRYSYTNRELDTETGLFYYRARYYDSKIGRFIEEDPHPGDKVSPSTLNSKYAYVQNNPMNYKDPSGRIGIVGSLIIVGGLISAVGNMRAVSENGGTFEDVFVSGLIGFAAGAITTYGSIYYGPLGAALFGVLGGAVNTIGNQLYFNDGEVTSWDEVAQAALITGATSYVFNSVFTSKVLIKGYSDSISLTISIPTSSLPENSIPEDLDKKRECERFNMEWRDGQCYTQRPR